VLPRSLCHESFLRAGTDGDNPSIVGWVSTQLHLHSTRRMRMRQALKLLLPLKWCLDFSQTSSVHDDILSLLMSASANYLSGVSIYQTKELLFLGTRQTPHTIALKKDSQLLIRSHRSSAVSHDTADSGRPLSPNNHARAITYAGVPRSEEIIPLSALPGMAPTLSTTTR